MALRKTYKAYDEAQEKAQSATKGSQGSSAANQSQAARKQAPREVPVNTYKPKTPFEGTVTGNYSLLKEGAIGRVNHITFDLKESDPFLNLESKFSDVSP